MRLVTVLGTGSRLGSAVVKCIPDLANFYSCIYRRERCQDSGAAGADPPAVARMNSEHKVWILNFLKSPPLADTLCTNIIWFLECHSTYTSSTLLLVVNYYLASKYIDTAALSYQATLRKIFISGTHHHMYSRATYILSSN
jgi:hypothetical protein